MPIGSTSHLRTMAPLSDEELDELDQFLLSEATSDETMMLSGLDGYLTAIVVGPETVMPSTWLPGVWGPTETDAPAFQTTEQAQRILTLIMRHMNGIIGSLRHDPDVFEPMFESFKQAGNRREYLDGETWAHGFMQGIALSRNKWQPLFDDKKMLQALNPIYLLGSDEMADEEDTLTRTPGQREKIAKVIPSTVAAIYRFWLSRCATTNVPVAATATLHQVHKTGRNEPCPCGSGKKFKKCCGAPRTVH